MGSASNEGSTFLLVVVFVLVVSSMAGDDLTISFTAALLLRLSLSIDARR